MARSAAEISIADVIRALDGELANVRGSRPEHLDYTGAASALQQVWIALRASERTILEGVTLAHVSSGELPEFVSTLVANPAAWIEVVAHSSGRSGVSTFSDNFTIACRRCQVARVSSMVFVESIRKISSIWRATSALKTSRLIS